MCQSDETMKIVEMLVADVVKFEMTECNVHILWLPIKLSACPLDSALKNGPMQNRRIWWEYQLHQMLSPAHFMCNFAAVKNERRMDVDNVERIMNVEWTWIKSMYSVWLCV